MSNRTDFRNVASEILADYPPGYENDLWADYQKNRIETELQNAFVAGEESEERYQGKLLKALCRLVSAYTKYRLKLCGFEAFQNAISKMDNLLDGKKDQDASNSS